MSVDTGKELFRLGFLTAIEVPDRGYVGGLLVTNHFGRPLEFQCTAPLKPNRTQEILYGPTLVPYVLGDLIGRTLIEKVGVKPHLVLTERMELLDLRELVEIPVACVDDVSADLLTTTTRGPESAPPAESDEMETASEPVATEEPAPVLTAAVAESPESGVVESPLAETGPLVEVSMPEVPPKAIAEDVTNRKPVRKAPPEADGPGIQLGRQMLRFHAAHSDDRSVAKRGAQLVPNNADLREPFDRVREALGETARMGGTR
jgi:hypothetical protein